MTTSVAYFGSSRSADLIRRSGLSLDLRSPRVIPDVRGFYRCFDRRGSHQRNDRRGGVMSSMIGTTIVGVAALACAAGAIAGGPNGSVGRQASVASRAPVVVADPAIVRLGGSASVTARGLAGRRLEVRLVGATTAAGVPLGWRPLRLAGKAWRGSLPKPALRGIYPIEVRAGAGQPVARSATWMLRVFATGTLSRPSFARPEGVAKWWVRTATGHARLIALR